MNGADAEDDEDLFTEMTAVHINEKLLKLSIPQLSRPEQIQLADIVECAGLVEKHRRSMDENGAIFMLFFRQNALRKGRTSQIQLSWREINWAFHSNSQDILVDFVSRQSNSEMLWGRARESGIFMWLSDPAALVSNRVRIHETVLSNVESRKRSLRLLPVTSTPKVKIKTLSTAVFIT